MFSSAHSGLLEKLFHYIDLHQDEFVQVGEVTREAPPIPFRTWWQLFTGRCGMLCLEI
jgi:hypothetical protein